MNAQRIKAANLFLSRLLALIPAGAGANTLEGVRNIQFLLGPAQRAASMGLVCRATAD